MKAQLEISFESEVHNIYDPEFSSTQSSFINESRDIESFVSVETVPKEDEINPQRTIRGLHSATNSITPLPIVITPDGEYPTNVSHPLVRKEDPPHLLFRHYSDHYKNEVSLELSFKNDDCQSNRNYYSKYLNNNSKETVKSKLFG